MAVVSIHLPGRSVRAARSALFLSHLEMRVQPSDAVNVDIPDSDIAAQVDFAKKNDVKLTVIGPEVPLCLGIVDAFRSDGLAVFGPSKEAAQLEGSKIFCKQVLRNAQVPTAEWHEFNNVAGGMEYLNNRFPPDENDAGKSVPAPVVVKADGLAAGKGAIVCSTRDDVIEAIDRVAGRREFGNSGDKVHH